MLKLKIVATGLDKQETCTFTGEYINSIQPYPLYIDGLLFHYSRLISERTVEENILKKANQKRLLGDIAIEGGNFTAATFKKVFKLLNCFTFEADLI
jgi:hypothetical protein